MDSAEIQKLKDDLAQARDTRDRAQAEATRQTLIARDLDRQLTRLLTSQLGITLIANERKRQIEIEGWTPEHDDTHLRGEMALAAARYAVVDQPSVEATLARVWPWSSDWWKPKGQVRNLIKAGALIAAEIDRRLRLSGVESAVEVLPPAGEITDYELTSICEDADTALERCGGGGRRWWVRECFLPALNRAGWYIRKA